MNEDEFFQYRINLAHRLDVLVSEQKEARVLLDKLNLAMEAEWARSRKLAEALNRLRDMGHAGGMQGSHINELELFDIADRAIKEYESTK